MISADRLLLEAGLVGLDDLRSSRAMSSSWPGSTIMHDLARSRRTLLLARSRHWPGGVDTR